MIAEFEMNGLKVTFDFSFFSANPILEPEKLETILVCDYCQRAGVSFDRLFSTFELERGFSYLADWARIDGITYPCHMTAEGQLIDTSEEKFQEVIDTFKSLIQPRIMHLNTDCLSAWKLDETAHPGVLIREPKYMTSQSKK